MGALLALHRTAAGYTQQSLAEHFVISEDHIASIEQGRRSLKMDLAVQLDELFRTGGTLETAVANMPDVDLLPRFAEEYLDQEQEAIVIEWYETMLVPGLLQTKAYARALFRGRIPPFDENKIEELVTQRMARQNIIRREQPPIVSFVLLEAVLRNRLGGGGVQAEQLRHLRECADLPGLSLQVLPLNDMSNPAFTGPFIVLETPEHQRLIYMETHRGSHLIADPDSVAILAHKYAMLRADALNVGAPSACWTGC
ncbi:helix-turn-helix transcriptional regulator [Streptomyces sp. NRRL B-1347]|uniref:helix-turn-helix domain-containing protein n=1 Tax=Streptomyces sp. NRRL B-1347 TaxID=1476877 RepID=UPI000B003BCE|nr:helix-turn-helix transcriptional regulator [Streptomyces sp. NRRL B-1347]